MSNILNNTNMMGNTGTMSNNLLSPQTTNSNKTVTKRPSGQSLSRVNSNNVLSYSTVNSGNGVIGWDQIEARLLEKEK
tara:strand:+ start:603 stop:836 length:234 start_codon:yes stop_codon:yes gene_type:complete